MQTVASFVRVWDAIAETPAQAANLGARAEAARRCGVTRTRLDDLLRGRVSRYSLDALVNIATTLGWRVRVDIEAS